jgi:glycosyltransferase involved in cell wall biosynthesis
MWLSVIIAAYNAEDTLPTAVDSLLAQHYPDVELIIVDDGSTDATLEVARRIAVGHPNVTVLTQANAGTAAAVNAGLRAAHGEYVARLDADDELTDDYLATMSAFIGEHPNFDIYGMDLIRVSPGEPEAPVYGWSDVRSATLGEMFTRNVIPGAGTIARRDLLERLGGCREGVLNEDYDLWLRALAAGATHVHCPRALYRYHQGSGAQKTENLIAQYESSIQIIEHLTATTDLSDADKHAAQDGIDLYRDLIDDIEHWGGSKGYRLRDTWPEAEAEAYRRFLGRFLSDAGVERGVRLTQKVAWIVRPIRKAIWLMRSRSAK